MHAIPFRARRRILRWTRDELELARADFKKQFGYEFECKFCTYHASMLSFAVQLSGGTTTFCAEHLFQILAAINSVSDIFGFKAEECSTKGHLADVPVYEWGPSEKKWKQVIGPDQ